MSNYSIYPSTSASKYWLVPPSAPKPGSTNDITFTLTNIGGPDLAKGNANQNITGSGITLSWDVDVTPAIATVTIPNAIWMCPSDSRSTLHTAWTTFLGELDKLEPQGGIGNQYTINGGGRIIAAAVLQHLPLPIDELKYYGLGFSYYDTANTKSTYNHEHYIDLQLGMRLKLSYSTWYGDEIEGEIQGGFSGNGVGYIDLQSSTESNGIVLDAFMDFQDVKVTPAIDASTSLQLSANVLDLAAQEEKPHFRLYYPAGTSKNPVGQYDSLSTLNNSTANNISLLSSYCFGTLPVSAPDAIGGIPESCSTYLPNALPTIFFGRVNVVPEIEISVNGECEFVEAGTTLRNLIERELQTSTIPKTLRLYRYYEYSPAELEFSDAPIQALDIPVQSGDSVSWGYSDAFSLDERAQALYNIATPPLTATQLTGNILESFSTDKQDTPNANTMAEALRAVLATNGSAVYDVEEIALAIYTNYQPPVRKKAITPNELAFALYFAGYDATDVAKGLVAGVSPSIAPPNGEALVEAMLNSGVGYTVNEISIGAFSALFNNDFSKASNLVKDLFLGSEAAGKQYSMDEVAEGLYHAHHETATDASDIAGALITGSMEAGLGTGDAGADEYAHALIYAYDTENHALNFAEVVDGLANALVGQPYQLTIEEVAIGAFSQFDYETPDEVASALAHTNAGYSIEDVAKGVYAITTYVDTSSGTGQLTPLQLANTLRDAYGTAANEYNVALSLYEAIVPLQSDPLTLTKALYYSFDLTSPTDTLEKEANINLTSEAIQAVGYSFKQVTTGLMGAFVSYITPNLLADALYTTFTPTINLGYKGVAVTRLQVAEAIFNQFFKGTVDATSLANLHTTAIAIKGAFSSTTWAPQLMADDLVQAFSLSTTSILQGDVNNITQVVSNYYSATPNTVAEAVCHAFEFKETGSETLTQVEYIATAMEKATQNYDPLDVAAALYAAFHGISEYDFCEALYHAYKGTGKFHATKAATAIVSNFTLIKKGMGNATLLSNMEGVASAITEVFTLTAFNQTDVSELANAIAVAFQLTTPTNNTKPYSYRQQNVNDVAITLFDVYSETGRSQVGANTIGYALQQAFTSITDAQVAEAIAVAFGMTTSTMSASSLEELAVAIVSNDKGISDTDLAILLHDQYAMAFTQNDVSDVATTLTNICTTQYGLGRTTSPDSVADALVAAFSFKLLNSAGQQLFQDEIDTTLIALKAAFPNSKPDEVMSAAYGAFDMTDTGGIVEDEIGILLTAALAAGFSKIDACNAVYAVEPYLTPQELIPPFFAAYATKLTNDQYIHNTVSISSKTFVHTMEYQGLVQNTAEAVYTRFAAVAGTLPQQCLPTDPTDVAQLGRAFGYVWKKNMGDVKHEGHKFVDAMCAAHTYADTATAIKCLLPALVQMFYATNREAASGPATSSIQHPVSFGDFDAVASLVLDKFPAIHGSATLMSTFAHSLATAFEFNTSVNRDNVSEFAVLLSDTFSYTGSSEIDVSTLASMLSSAFGSALTEDLLAIALRDVFAYTGSDEVDVVNMAIALHDAIKDADPIAVADALIHNLDIESDDGAKAKFLAEALNTAFAWDETGTEQNAIDELAITLVGAYNYTGTPANEELLAHAILFVYPHASLTEIQAALKKAFAGESHSKTISLPNLVDYANLLLQIDPGTSLDEVASGLASQFPLTTASIPLLVQALVQVCAENSSPLSDTTTSDIACAISYSIPTTASFANLKPLASALQTYCASMITASGNTVAHELVKALVDAYDLDGTGIDATTLQANATLLAEICGANPSDISPGSGATWKGQPGGGLNLPIEDCGSALLNTFPSITGMELFNAWYQGYYICLDYSGTSQLPDTYPPLLKLFVSTYGTAPTVQSVGQISAAIGTIFNGNTNQFYLPGQHVFSWESVNNVTSLLQGLCSVYSVTISDSFDDKLCTILRGFGSNGQFGDQPIANVLFEVLYNIYSSKITNATIATSIALGYRRLGANVPQGALNTLAGAMVNLNQDITDLKVANAFTSAMGISYTPEYATAIVTTLINMTKPPIWPYLAKRTVIPASVCEALASSFGASNITASQVTTAMMDAFEYPETANLQEEMNVVAQGIVSGFGWTDTGTDNADVTQLANTLISKFDLDVSSAKAPDLFALIGALVNGFGYNNSLADDHGVGLVLDYFIDQLSRLGIIITPGQSTSNVEYILKVMAIGGWPAPDANFPNYGGGVLASTVAHLQTKCGPFERDHMMTMIYNAIDQLIPYHLVSAINAAYPNTLPGGSDVSDMITKFGTLYNLSNLNCDYSQYKANTNKANMLGSALFFAGYPEATFTSAISSLGITNLKVSPWNNDGIRGKNAWTAIKDNNYLSEAELQNWLSNANTFVNKNNDWGNANYYLGGLVSTFDLIRSLDTAIIDAIAKPVYTNDGSHQEAINVLVDALQPDPANSSYINQQVWKFK